MRRDLPPLTWLRAFEASARTLSFTNAGMELNLTQAAVSKHVKALELHLRQPLFLRRPRSLELTKSGEAYLPKVQDALERLAQGTREVFGRQSGQVLTLRCAVSFAVNWLSSRLPAFFDAHPEIQIRLISSVWNDPFDKDVFDLDIQYGTGDWLGFSPTRLTWETITPLCAPTLLDRGDLLCPDDLRRHRLLHVMGYQEGWAVWLNAAAARGVDPGEGLQLDNSLTAFRMAADGGGVALGRSSLAADDLAAGRLIAPFNLKVPIKEAFYLLEPQTPSRHPFRDLLADWIKQQAISGNSLTVDHR